MGFPKYCPRRSEGTCASWRCYNFASATHIWEYFKVFALKTPHWKNGSTDYFEFLLEVGDGTICSTHFGEGQHSCNLIPQTEITFVTQLTDLIDLLFYSHSLYKPDLISRQAILYKKYHWTGNVRLLLCGVLCKY